MLELQEYSSLCLCGCETVFTDAGTVACFQALPHCKRRIAGQNLETKLQEGCVENSC